jgi:phage terminase small subunit
MKAEKLIQLETGKLTKEKYSQWFSSYFAKKMERKSKIIIDKPNHSNNQRKPAMQANQIFINNLNELS